MPDGGGLVQPQALLRGLLARVACSSAQLRLEQSRIGAQAPGRQFARQPRRALRLGLREELVLQG